MALMPANVFSWSSPVFNHFQRKDSASLLRLQDVKNVHRNLHNTRAMHTWEIT
jgi:hypothetical protein